MKNKFKINSDDGFAAIIITMIILAIIGLLVLGFATNTINNQKIALDNILSTQAYYDAESGINDAYTTLSAYGKTANDLSNLPTSISNCTNNSYVVSNSNVLNPNNSYTCLLVNPQPTTLEFKPISQLQGQVFPIESPPSSGGGGPRSNINFVVFNWQSHNITGSPVFSGCNPSLGKFNTPNTLNSFSCSAPVIQIDFVPMNKITAGISPTSLNQSTLNFYLEPISSNNTSTPVSGTMNSPTTPTEGSVYRPYCSPAVTANFEFSCYFVMQVPSNLVYSGYYVHLVPIYYDADVSVSASMGINYSSSTSVPLFGAQALIDSTGDSAGVLRRLEERVCISSLCNNSAPSAAIISNSDICKKFTAMPGQVVDASGFCSVP